MLRLVAAAGFLAVLITQGADIAPLVVLFTYAALSIFLLLNPTRIHRPKTLILLVLFDLAFFAIIASLTPTPNGLLLMAVFLVVLTSILIRRVAFALPVALFCAAIYACALTHHPINWETFPAEVALLFVVSLIVSYYTETISHIWEDPEKLTPPHITPDGKENQTAEQLMRIQYVLNAVASHMPHAIVIFEKDVPTYINHSFYRMFKIEGWVNPFDVKEPEKVIAIFKRFGVMDIIKQTIHTGEISGPVEKMEPEGERRVFRFNVFPVRSPFEKELGRVIVTVHDVTKIKEEQRRRCEVERREGEVRALAQILSLLRRAVTILKTEPDETILPLDKIAGGVLNYAALASLLETEDKHLSLKIFPGIKLTQNYVDRLARNIIEEFRRIRNEPVKEEDVSVEVVGETHPNGLDEPKGLFTAPIWVDGKVKALLAVATEDERVQLTQRMLLDAIALHYQVVMTRLVMSQKERQLHHRVETITSNLQHHKMLLEEAKRLEQLKSNIILIVSHELRTPLTIISASLQLLENMIPQDSKSRALFERLRNNTNRMSLLLDRITQVAVLESRSVSLKKRPVLLRETAEAALNLISAAAEAKSTRFHIEIPPTLKVCADPEATQQIFHILMENAVIHTPEGTDVFVSAHNKGDMVEISVRDTGQGLRPKDAKSVFDTFSQANRKVGGGYHGLGLGLPVAKHLVLLQGGEIRLETEPDKGCNFIFTLPAMDSSGGAKDGCKEDSRG